MKNSERQVRITASVSDPVYPYIDSDGNTGIIIPMAVDEIEIHYARFRHRYGRDAAIKWLRRKLAEEIF